MPIMTVEERVKAVIGDLVLKQMVLEAELEKLRAEIEKMKPPPAEAD